MPRASGSGASGERVAGSLTREEVEAEHRHGAALARATIVVRVAEVLGVRQFRAARDRAAGREHRERAARNAGAAGLSSEAVLRAITAEDDAPGVAGAFDAASLRVAALASVAAEIAHVVSAEDPGAAAPGGEDADQGDDERERGYHRRPAMAETETADHVQPSRPSRDAAPPFLACAFPVAVAAPLPIGAGAVGRDWLAQMGIRDTEVSGKHCLFTRARGGGFELEDAGSRNGTFVDGERIERCRLRDRSVLRVGRTLFVFRELPLGPSPASTPVPRPNIGRMIGPFGLAGIAQAIAEWTARPPRNVLILGETGTGKELAAEAIAAALGRAPLVPINVGAVPAGVFEAQLFGHVQGAFSDARRASRGVVASAERGAVFLDEIGDLPIDLQPKILRLLENHEILPVGAERPTKVDVLLLAATHQPLEAMVASGAFRRDLLARLAASVVKLLPLRERPEDLFPILLELARQAGTPLDVGRCEVEAIERLLLHEWPSNVRELAAVLAQVRSLAAGAGQRDGLTAWAVREVLGDDERSPSGRALTAARVREVLEACGGNESEAARRLGVSRGALRRFRERGEDDPAHR